MTNYYLDTSALGKRYVHESGSNWIRTITDRAVGHVIIICDLTPVEGFSRLARRQRMSQLTSANARILQNRFLVDYRREYIALPLERSLLIHARWLLVRYPLRSLDAIQLAGATGAFRTLGAPITFVSADLNLLNAAVSEGFITDNPNLHP